MIGVTLGDVIVYTAVAVVYCAVLYYVVKGKDGPFED